MKLKKSLLVVVLLLAVIALSGCANTIIGAGGTPPAKEIVGAWAPSGETAPEKILYMYATGNATLGGKEFTWRVDSEAKDPSKLVTTDTNGKASTGVLDFDSEGNTLALTGGAFAEGGKVTYKRQVKLQTPAFNLGEGTVKEGE